MDTRMTRTWAEVHLDNIAHNYHQLSAALPAGSTCLGVVKTNAYGHGALPTAKLLEALGCPYLAVACFDEAAALRRAGVAAPILILGRSVPELAGELAALSITQAVGDFETAAAMSARLAPAGARLKIHLKLETGMGRTGFHVGDAEAFAALERVLSLPGLEAEGVFTHFAVSDDREEDAYTREQFRRFTAAIARLEKDTGHHFSLRHCANSGAVINYKEMCLDMVRPGIALYGLYPGPDRGDIALRPAMELKSRIAAITHHLAGDSISYGRTYQTARPTRLAVLPIGYGDGLHRVLSNKLEVLIHGRRAAQVGRICMDMCMVDVTDIPCQVGDVATLWGQSEGAFLPVEEAAEKAGTISYELLCALSPRVPRIYGDIWDGACINLPAPRENDSAALHKM